jgi:anti-anti-sigma factor
MTIAVTSAPLAAAAAFVAGVMGLPPAAATGSWIGLVRFVVAPRGGPAVRAAILRRGGTVLSVLSGIGVVQRVRLPGRRPTALHGRLSRVREVSIAAPACVVPESPDQGLASASVPVVFCALGAPLCHMGGAVALTSPERSFEVRGNTLHVTGELSLDSEPALATTLADLVNSDNETIIVDMLDVTFMSSSYVRHLVDAVMELAKSSRTMTIRARGQVLRVLKMVQLDSLAVVEVPRSGQQ